MISGPAHVVLPRVEQIAGSFELFLVVVPDLFGDLDPDATFKELHARFLPLDYKPGYFVSLKGE